MPTPIAKARRGDAVLIEQEHSTTYAFGSGRSTERTKTYALALVTSVTRDGLVKAAERPNTAPWPWKFGAPGKCWVITNRAVCPDAAELVRRIYASTSEEFANIEQARSAIAAVCEQLRGEG